jgi:Ras-related protein Rab-2A
VEWLDEIKEHGNPHISVLLIGNKSDLEESRVVKREDAERLAKANGMEYIEASAKTGLHVEDVRQIAIIIW